MNRATLRAVPVLLGAALAMGACRNEPDESALLAVQAPLAPSSNQHPAPVGLPFPDVQPSATARTPCEISYEQTKALLGEAPPPPLPSEASEKGTAADLQPSLAPREQYLRDCEELPRKVQECLVFDYAMAHEEECRIARAEYDDPRTAPSPGG